MWGRSKAAGTPRSTLELKTRHPRLPPLYTSIPFLTKQRTRAGMTEMPPHPKDLAGDLDSKTPCKRRRGWWTREVHGAQVHAVPGPGGELQRARNSGQAPAGAQRASLTGAPVPPGGCWGEGQGLRFRQIWLRGPAWPSLESHGADGPARLLYLLGEAKERALSARRGAAHAASAPQTSADSEVRLTRCYVTFRRPNGTFIDSVPLLSVS